MVNIIDDALSVPIKDSQPGDTVQFCSCLLLASADVFM